jgi:uncharacterized SAM-binding protein YcdF (DUF218 family)
MSRSIKIVLIVSTLFVFWVVTAPKLATALIVERKLEKADAIIVLSGSAVYQERTRKAASVYRSRVSPIIVLSDDGGEAGWSHVEERNPKFVELATRSLVDQGVPPESIVEMEADVTGTKEEAAAFRNEALKRRWKSVLIVTSAYHTRRALNTFQKEFSGIDMSIGIESPPPGERTPPPFTWWLTGRGWRLVAGEYVKMAYYWLYY